MPDGMLPPALSRALTRDILQFLGVEAGKPDAVFLRALVDRYVHAVPWESASRIAARAAVDRGISHDPPGIPRWSEQFWIEAMQLGTGGTCFESNRAVGALLHGLGFSGYLTINNMAEVRGCHTAIVVECDGARWLVDAGYPLHAPVPINPEAESRAESPVLDYVVTPAGPARYVVESHPHPRPYAFTLIDIPVADPDYCAATGADYGPGGNFLDRIILRKCVDGRIWRFDHRDQPYRVQVFDRGSRAEIPLDDEAPEALSRMFGMDGAVLASAFDALGAPRA